MTDAKNTDFRRISDADMTQRQWAAWSRDKDGLICTSHAAFESMAEWEKYVSEESKRGLRGFYPHGPLKMWIEL